MQIGRQMGDEAAFKARVVPIIGALFASSDHAMRNALVTNIADYAPLLSPAVVESSVLPPLLRGLQARSGIRNWSLGTLRRCTHAGVSSGSRRESALIPSLPCTTFSAFHQKAWWLQEANAYSREQALKALLPVAPKLSQRTLNGALLKHLAKLQARARPPAPPACRTLLLCCLARLRQPFSVHAVESPVST